MFSTDSFYDSKSLFDNLWEEWLHTQLINLSADTPMADMDYEDVLKCLPGEKRKELFDKRFRFAEKTGIEGILDKSAPDLWSEEFMKTLKTWSRDWEHFDWGQIRENLCKVKSRQAGETVCNAEIGISFEELTEYFEWLHDNNPKYYYKSMLALLLLQAGFSEDEAQPWVNRPEELDQLLREMLEESD